jgi:hypothetical protein
MQPLVSHKTGIESQAATLADDHYVPDTNTDTIK